MSVIESTAHVWNSLISVVHMPRVSIATVTLDIKCIHEDDLTVWNTRLLDNSVHGKYIGQVAIIKKVFGSTNQDCPVITLLCGSMGGNQQQGTPDHAYEHNIETVHLLETDAVELQDRIQIIPMQLSVVYNFLKWRIVFLSVYCKLQYTSCNKLFVYTLKIIIIIKIENQNEFSLSQN